MHVTARLRIDSIRIGGRDIVNGYSIHRHIVAKLRINGPERRIDDFHPFDAYVLATDRLDERRTEETAVQRSMPVFVCLGGNLRHIICLLKHGLIFVDVTLAIIPQVNQDLEEFVPPGLALSIKSSFSFDGDIFGIDGIDKRTETLHHHSLVTHLHKGQVVIKIRRKEQGRSSFQLQRNVALQVNRTRQIPSGRKEQRTASLLLQAFDGTVDKSGVDSLAIRLGTCLLHVDTFGPRQGRHRKQQNHGQKVFKHSLYKI